MMGRTKIVVGVDGSDPSRAALRYAAAEAHRRGGALRVLTAYDINWAAGRFGGIAELEQVVRNRYRDLVAKAVADAQSIHPDLPVTGDALLGDPARILLDAADTATLLVVGHRGHGGFASLLLGSVSQRVATHAKCPVVVVRGTVDPAAGPVIVGVDDTPAANHALAAAFEEAAQRGCPLVAVRAYPTPLPIWTVGVPPLAYDTEAVKRETARDLESTLVGWREKYPTVPVETLVDPGSAARALVDVSGKAGLVVVGSRGHIAVVGALVGSVGLQLLHHAHCPVLIAPGSGNPAHA
jgi:nucleotide-binding universal stress UspA family protein